MFDPKTVKVTHQWKHDAPLMWCRFDPNGEYVFATSEDQSIQRWRLSDEHKTPLAAHESWVRDLAFSPDGRLLAAAVAHPGGLTALARSVAVHVKMLMDAGS